MITSFLFSFLTSQIPFLFLLLFILFRFFLFYIPSLPPCLLCFFSGFSLFPYFFLSLSLSLIHSLFPSLLSIFPGEWPSGGPEPQSLRVPGQCFRKVQLPGLCAQCTSCDWRQRNQPNLIFTNPSPYKV